MNQTRRILLMLIIFISTFTFAQAQRGDRNRSPEETANLTTLAMADSLALSDAQIEKIAEVNLKYATKMSAARTKAREDENSDWSKMRELMQNMRAEQNTELKKYLTAAQFDKWEKIQANRRGKRRGKGPRGGKGRKGDRKKKDQEGTDNN